MKNAWKAYWLLVVIMLANYLIMVLWSLPYLADLGGSAPFDMRPSGYSFDEAVNFITSLGDDGRDFYLTIQHLLDMFYPALLAIVLIIALVKLGGKPVGWIFAAFALAGSTFDYLENNAVAAMLKAGPEQLTENMVMTASSWTLYKSMSSTVAFVGLIALGSFRLYKYWKAKRA